jgi:hypothetical protein
MRLGSLMSEDGIPLLHRGLAYWLWAPHQGHTYVLTGVGWGIVVGARESRGHQDADFRRRPLAFGKTETKVPSSTSVHGWTPVELEKWAQTLPGIPMEIDQRC